MRFTVHHEGADYDNPEEIIISDTDTGRELVITAAKNGFRWTMLDGTDIDSMTSGAITE